MFWQNLKFRGHTVGVALVLIAAVIVLALVAVTPTQAHCDSEAGPVAQAARQALQTGDVKVILPYVQPDAEAELTAAFLEVLEVRRTGGAAQELADRYFVETAVRLHRTGEGAPYTGVTDEPIPTSILAADKLMETGSTKEVYRMLDEAIRHGVQERYEAVIAARAQAEKLNTVEAHRERAEAELLFEKYIYELYSVATGAQGHTEGGAPAEGASHTEGAAHTLGAPQTEGEVHSEVASQTAGSLPAYLGTTPLPR